MVPVLEIYFRGQCPVTVYYVRMESIRHRQAVPYDCGELLIVADT